MDAHRGADAPRELVALVQRRSLAFLPLWAALALVGGMGASGFETPTEGQLDPVLVVYVVGFVSMFILRRWHRRHYGDVRVSEAQRLRGVLFGLAMAGAFVLMTIVGPRAVPSPLPFTFAAIFAASLLWEPWRVSAHWLVVIGVLLWLSIIHAVGPAWLMAPWAYPLLIGVAGTFACIVDHVLMLRLMRSAPRAMAVEASHV